MIITTDSRYTPEGSTFVALHGEKFDGNRFAIAALESGCAQAVVDDANLLEAHPEYASRLVLVADTLQAYKDMAREHRRRLDIPVIGITGTNGKTTTKELIAAVLQTKYRVLFTQGNFNNDVGVPKTLLALTEEHEIAVVEMGASHPGDIRTLVETVEPTCGLITNVGRAHLQGFGSYEGVKSTKGELYDWLVGHGAYAFINGEDEVLQAMARERGVATVAYAAGEVVASDPFVVVRCGEMLISTQLVGAYNLPNVLAAVTIGRRFGVEDELIKRALEDYRPTNNRSQLVETGRNRLIVDAYNANPSSMALAIENFATMAAQRKMLIVGAMGELGEDSAVEHQRVMELIRARGFSEVWLVGEAWGEGLDPAWRLFATVEEVKEVLENETVSGMCILVKGSNSTRLYELPERL